jgi:hypothetical protein
MFLKNRRLRNEKRISLYLHHQDQRGNDTKQDTPHIGNLLISSGDQNFLMFSALNSCTSASKCSHNTFPKVSITSFNSPNLNSRSPLLHSAIYASNFSRPLWISLCCVSNSSSFLKAGIFLDRMGKMCCSSIVWCTVRWCAKSSPACRNERKVMPCGFLPDVQAP